MQEFLRDPMWQFVGAILAFLAIVISIVLYLKQRRTKSLTYEIISRTPLLSIEEEIKGDLQVLYRGNPIEQVHLIILKIINSGNTPIVSEDFDRPINFSYGEEAEIFTAEILETNPDSLEASINVKENKVVLNPILLNGEDTVTVKMLVSKFNEIKIDGRIIGVKEIKEYKESSIMFFFTAITGIILSFLGIYFFLIASKFEIFYFFIFLFGYLFMTVSLFMRMGKQSRKKVMRIIRAILGS